MVIDELGNLRAFIHRYFLDRLGYNSYWLKKLWLKRKSVEEATTLEMKAVEGVVGGYNRSRGEE